MAKKSRPKWTPERRKRFQAAVVARREAVKHTPTTPTTLLPTKLAVASSDGKVQIFNLVRGPVYFPAAED